MFVQDLARGLAGSASLGLLYRGSPEAFVDALCADALGHPAVDHPYLWRLAEGDLPDVRAALRDYCHQYSFYCAAFPAYLEALLGRLDAPAHRDLVLQNLREEQGLDETGGEAVPHTELFRRFRRAAGVTPEYATRTPPCTTVVLWRDQFLERCGAPQAGVGLGALGIGTEGVVSTVYGHLHEAVTAHTDLAPADYLFLTVHLDCDDDHADQMKQISVDLAGEPAQREALRFGVLSALELRRAFWDVMLARALAS